jgi:hypothetical protein
MVRGFFIVAGWQKLNERHGLFYKMSYNAIMLLVISFFLAGVLFTLLGVRLLFKRHILVAGVNGAAGLSLLSVSMVLGLILFNIHTYHQLTSEIKLARVEIGASGQAGTIVRLFTDGDRHEFNLNAKEWQLDARFLKWKSWAYLLGSEPVVRLESLTERKALDQSKPTRSYNLVTQNPLLSEAGSALSDWLGVVDTYFGSAVYMPAVEGSVYTVSATISGLIARAENQTARDAVTQWMKQ